jgi:hypothetical protein
MKKVIIVNVVMFAIGFFGMHEAAGQLASDGCASSFIICNP